jgi:hypothetical protein
VITALGFQAPFKTEKLLTSRMTIRASSRTSLYAMISTYVTSQNAMLGSAAIVSVTLTVVFCQSVAVATVMLSSALSTHLQLSGLVYCSCDFLPPRTVRKGEWRDCRSSQVRLL